MSDALRYGLIGERLGHSQSPALHGLLADYDYAAYEVRPDALAEFIRRPGIGGLNVTMPYKQAVMPLCDVLSPQARRIGSVNTLVYDEKGQITGHNTDYQGFCGMLARAGIGLAGQKVVILGSGGTACTARAVCEDAGARQIVTISRHGVETYHTLHRHRDAQVLINTTPVGMFPHGDEMPLVSLDDLPMLQGVVDVIYNPLRTRLVQSARARGIPATGGLPMLVWQAAQSVALFTGLPADETRTEHTLERLRCMVENIVLIGMPGCGKSTIGRQIAMLTGRTLIDTDDEIVRRMGKPIPRIFAEDGEVAFRAAEQEIVAEAAQRSGYVIATGGGTVLSEVNREALARNGRLAFLKRPLNLLAVAGRPLSTDIEAMAAVRLPIYAAASDFVVDNTDTVDGAANRTWEAFSACGYS